MVTHFERGTGPAARIRELRRAGDTLFFPGDEAARRSARVAAHSSAKVMGFRIATETTQKKGVDGVLITRLPMEKL